MFAKDPNLLDRVKASFKAQKLTLDCYTFDTISHPHVVFAEMAGTGRFTRKNLAPAMYKACNDE